MASRKRKEAPFPTAHIDVPARDQRLLKATLVTPKHSKPTDPVVLIAPATAVPRIFYVPYMWFLASQGVAGLSFDFRGSHGSLPNKDPTASKDTLSEWAALDLPAMIDFMKERFPTRRLVFIGHSVGGHIMPLPDNADKLSHCMTVGTQNAYYPLTPFRYRYGYLWSVLVPASTQMFGYYPGNKLGIIGAVPTTIMQSWRAWATHPLYVRGRHLETQETPVDRFKHFNKPVLAISMDDDEFATEKAVHLFHEMLGSNVIHWHIDHHKLPGRPQVKHVGFFTSKFAKSLWPVSLQYIKNEAVTFADGVHEPTYEPEPGHPGISAKL